MMTKKDYELIAEAIKDVGLWYHVGEGERQHGAGVGTRAGCRESTLRPGAVHGCL